MALSATSVKSRQIIVFAVAALFVAINGVAVLNEFYFLSLLPVAGLLVWLALFRLDYLLWFIVVCTPLSLSLEALEVGADINMYLPTEPLMFGTMLVFLLRTLYQGNYPREVLKHPITIAIAANLVWMGLTSITSEMPTVSFKYLLSRLWFVFSFYFLLLTFFRNQRNLFRFPWLYAIPMVIVIAYTVVRHAGMGFGDKPAHWVMQPFFKDHTSYGALLVFFFPFLVGSLFFKRMPMHLKIASGLVLFVFTIGTIFSYTRAAWVSLVGAFAVFLAMYFKIHFRWLALAAFVVVGGFFANQTAIMHKLEKNKQDSSEELAEHVQSITNVATDASNLERINRWNCAIDMFQERPFWGWGPGTYMFLYAPYQNSQDLTIISTNFGDLGNAHSEYLGPLSESGLFGMLTMIALLIVVCVTAVRLYNQLPRGDLRILLVTAFLGLVTYFTHGVLNNYLDTDKASVPFWGFIALVVAIDVWHKEQQAEA